MTTTAFHYTDSLPAVLTAPAKLPHWRTTLCRLGAATDTDRAWLKSFPTLRDAWFGTNKAYRLAWICGALDVEMPPGSAAEVRAKVAFDVVERAMKKAQRKARDKRGLQ